MNIHKSCDHCREDVVHEYKLEANSSTKYFCCNGCLTVYKILNDNGLGEYYKLQESFGSLGPADLSKDTFSYLDEKEFKEKYLVISDGKYTFQFFVEGVHCVACLWLLEKLSDLNSGIIQSKLNMANSTLNVVVDENLPLSQVARLLSSIGYRPHPILQDADRDLYAKKEDRKALIQIGVAFACAGNIMLYSLAVYNGAEGFFKDYFNLFIFLCSLPVIFYSAIPFYKNAFHSLKLKEPSIDVPIVVALIVGMGMGVYSLIYNKDYFYFDTLSTLVFLLLFARYILRKTQQKSLRSDDLSSFFTGESANRIVDGKEEEVYTRFLNKGDDVVIYPGEVIPIDGVITSGESFINNSLLTGEVVPVRVKTDDQIFMGAKNLDAKLMIRVSSTIDETRLGKILKEVEDGWKAESRISLITDKISKNFVYFVFSLASLFFIYFSITQGLEVAFSRTLTLLIITCPCALALTTPLALILGLSYMAKQGVIIKNEQVIEKLADIKNIFLDKTGTLTHGDFFVKEVSRSNCTDVDFEVLAALEARSTHPIANSMTKYLEGNGVNLELELSNYKETPGVGVSGEFNGDHFEVKACDNNSSENTTIGLFKNSKSVATFEILDRIRSGAKHTVDGFKKLNITPFILSGDKKAPVEHLAGKLSIDPKHIYFEVSPEAKRDIVKSVDKSLMVGDGVNDAVALKAAYIGIAVKGSVEVSLRAADVYLSKSNVNHILNIIKGSRFIIKIIYRNLAFSLIYNLFGIFLAFSGQVTPLLAAILMPLSSLTVLASTIFSIKRLKNIIN